MIGIVYGYYVKNGGISRYISEYAKRLNNHSKTQILTLEDTINQKIPDVDIILCERHKDFMSIIENKSFSKEINNISKNYSAIHVHGLYDIIPDMYTAHICLNKYFERLKDIFGKGHLYNYDNLSYMVDIEERLISNIPADRIVVVSEKLSKELSDSYGLDRKKILPILGASRFNYSSLEERRYEPKKTYNVGFIGGDLYSKGIIFMKDVFNKLESRGLHINCIGAGCDDAMKRYMSENVLFTSKIFEKIDVNEKFYGSLDLFLCLSVYDSFSLSALEAMSLNVPVLSSNNIGIFEDNHSAKLARVNDITNSDEVSMLIERIFTDRVYTDEISKAGLDIANKLSWSDTALQYDVLYTGLS